MSIHFLYEPDKEPNASFALSLIREFGQTSMAQSDTIVSIGGDGLLLQAMRRGAGKNVCGIVPPESNSRGFWTNRNIHSADDLKAMLEVAERYPIKPLQASIEFDDGSQTTRYGYNDITVQGVHSDLSEELRENYELSSIDFSTQSVLISLSASFSKAAIGPVRVMGTGLIFATPSGSTAMTRNYGGPSIDIRNEAIVLTGMGTTEPVKGFSPVVVNGHAKFDIEVNSSSKRPIKMTFDSFGIVANENNSPIKRMGISMAHDRQVALILNEDPGSRAFSAMLPH